MTGDFRGASIRGPFRGPLEKEGPGPLGPPRNSTTDHNPPTSQTDEQTDGQTDRQTTCDRKTALCTLVHRAVKSLQ